MAAAVEAALGHKAGAFKVAGFGARVAPFAQAAAAVEAALDHKAAFLGLWMERTGEKLK